RVRGALRAAESHAGYPAPAQEPFWDLARLRILQEPLPDDLRRELLSALIRLFPGRRPPLAVRSSAPGEDAASASFAGIYRSVLGVRSDDALWDAIRACWSALWSRRAVEYRARAGVKSPPAIAVIVQQMVAAEAAGVAFSRDPATGEARVIINAVRGL